MTDDVMITVGVLQDGETSYTVYTPDGVDEEAEAVEYEIGSITKTFTGTLIARAVLEGMVDLDATIDTYLDLSAESEFPTVRQLLTHTSGYPTYF